jgi:hypothetical protein
MPFDATPSANFRLATITLIDAMLAYYVDESRWTKGCLHDGQGGRCVLRPAVPHDGLTGIAEVREVLATAGEAATRAMSSREQNGNQLP